MNELLTTVHEKLQVGTPQEPHDKFIIQCTGKTGGFGYPVFTSLERDALWLPGDFPNPDWKGSTIYNSTLDRVQFNTGTTWFTFEAGGAPVNVAAFYQQYADDATYVVNNGPAVDGSVYYNTTLLTVRVFSAGSWYNDLVSQPWANSVAYNVGQIVWDSNDQIYRCTIAHTSNAAGVIGDDIANWANMGAHAVGDLDDVDTAGAVENDVLVLDNAGVYKPVAKGTFATPLTVPVIAVEPASPATGFVVLWADDNKTIKAKYETGEVVEMLKQYNVIDFLDTPLLDASLIDHTAASYYVTVVASLAADVKAVQIYDTAGINLGWYDGSDNLLFVSGPGTNETTQVEIAAGTLIKVKPLAASASVFSGNYTVNFLG